MGTGPQLALRGPGCPGKESSRTRVGGRPCACFGTRTGASSGSAEVACLSFPFGGGVGLAPSALLPLCAGLAVAMRVAVRVAAVVVTPHPMGPSGCRVEEQGARGRGEGWLFQAQRTGVRGAGCRGAKCKGAGVQILGVGCGMQGCRGARVRGLPLTPAAHDLGRVPAAVAAAADHGGVALHEARAAAVAHGRLHRVLGPARAHGGRVVHGGGRPAQHCGDRHAAWPGGLQ